MFSCNLPPPPLAEEPGPFTCHCNNTEVERIPKLESAQKVDPGEENSPAAPAGVSTRDVSFDPESVALPLSYPRIRFPLNEVKGHNSTKGTEMAVLLAWFLNKMVITVMAVTKS